MGNQQNRSSNESQESNIPRSSSAKIESTSPSNPILELTPTGVREWFKELGLAAALTDYESKELNEEALLHVLKTRGVSEELIRKHREQIIQLLASKSVDIRLWLKLVAEQIEAFKIFPSVLIPIIVDYVKELRWDTSPIRTWRLPPSGWPCGILGYQNQIHLCTYNIRPPMLTYSAYGVPFHYTDQKNENVPIPEFSYPWHLDVFDNKYYIIDRSSVTILNEIKQVIKKWDLPTNGGYQRCIKIDHPIAYITLNNFNQIYLCQLDDGKVINTFGNKNTSTANGDFREPMGLTTDATDLYVCDQYNNRIQVLDKDKGKFIRKWGKYGKDDGDFYYPLSIYLHDKDGDDNLYIGDHAAIQIFTKHGEFRQRIGSQECGVEMDQFNYIYGVCVMNGELYATDWQNNRVKAYRPVAS